MTTFDNRENAFENKFAHDEELAFKAHSLSNRKIALWAAGQLGKTGDEASAYANSLVEAEVGLSINDADAHIAQHILGDFTKAGIEATEKTIRAEMKTQLQLAQQQVLGEKK